MAHKDAFPYRAASTISPLMCCSNSPHLNRAITLTKSVDGSIVSARQAPRTHPHCTTRKSALFRCIECVPECPRPVNVNLLANLSASELDFRAGEAALPRKHKRIIGQVQRALASGAGVIGRAADDCFVVGVGAAIPAVIECGLCAARVKHEKRRPHPGLLVPAIASNRQ
jgi:hypothetical protein